uniref:mRNA (guanine-N(7))-methyltransferase n=1 Tax=Theileria annulata TaxID=5874 RepID=A0A3B0MPW9_THEAN
MVNRPKSRRKVSNQDSTDSGPKELTCCDNPLLIQGYNLFDNQYKENTIHNRICHSIKESLDSISDPLSCNVIFQIGKLMSVVKSRSIVLPIETEAVLDFDSNKVKFVPNVSKQCLDSLYLNIFVSRSDYTKLVQNNDYLEVELVYNTKTCNSESRNSNKEGFCHSIIYRIPFVFNEQLNFNDLKQYTYNYLDSIIVYRPQSNYHFKVQTNCIISVDGNTKESRGSVMKMLFRHLRTYNSSKLENVKFIKFNLEVVDEWDIPINDELCSLEILEVIKACYETFIATNNSNSYPFIDLDNSEESKVKIIQISTDSSKISNNSQLYRQYKRLVEYKPNRFNYIVSLLESNTRMLLDLFDRTLFDGTELGKELDDRKFDGMDYYPNLFGDTAEFAQIHYDTRKVIRQQESAIEALRKYNNLVKRVLILCNIKKNTSVLELACGHAQDLDKYNTKRIRKLMGIDISMREINEARRRYGQRKRTLSFNAEFHHGNLLDPKIYSMFIKNNTFDVVSIQLAIHYILDTEASTNFILEKIYNSLNEGGLFIGSTICCDQLSKELASNINKSVNNTEVWEFGNPIFKITLDEKSVQEIKNSSENLNYTEIKDVLNTNWGLKYHFFLMESIDESEYVVPWRKFVDMCNRIGLKLVESYTFPEYLDKYRTLIENKRLELPQNVYENMDYHFKNISNYSFSNDQMRVFSLYKIFVFEKITGRDKLYIQGVKIKRN